MKYIKFLLTSLTLFTYQLHAAQNLIVNVPGDNASSTTGTFTFGSSTTSAGDLRGCLNHINTATTSAPDTFNITFNIPYDQTISLEKLLPIVNLVNSNTVTIDGTNGGNQIIIDGEGSFRGFFIRQGNVTLENITLSNTSATHNDSGLTGGGGGLGAGGGIFNDEADVTIDNVTFQKCTASGGSGEEANIGGCGGGGGMGGIGGSRGFRDALSGGGGGGGGIGGSGTNGEAIVNNTGDSSGGDGGGRPTRNEGGGLGAISATSWKKAGDGEYGGGGGSPGGNGGFGGGGGGAGRLSSIPGGDGGFGGGGGGGSLSNSTRAAGGKGGFGGGGGGGFEAGAGGIGGGNGDAEFGGGGGGAGFGGAIFSRAGSIRILGNTNTTGSRVLGGGSGSETAGTGSFAGEDFFGVTNGTDGFTSLIFDPIADRTISFTGSIGDTSANTLSKGDNPGNGPGLQLTKNGEGKLILLGANTYSGGTTITAGSLEGNTSSLQGNISNDGTLIFNQSDAAGAYVGIISGSGTFIKEGRATLTLIEANTYSGGTTINKGRLALSGAGALDPKGFLTINGGSFNISGIAAESQTIGDLIGKSGALINLGSKDFIVGTANSTTYAGAIQGNKGLTKQGSGVLTLTGSNDYFGGTIINGGTLALADNGSLVPTGAVTINEGAFDISGITAESQTIGALSGVGFVNLGDKNLIEDTVNHTMYSGVIQGGANGKFTKQGSSVLTLTGVNTYSGGTIINEGILALLGSGTLHPAGDVTVNAGIFNISDIAAESQTIGNLSGAGGIVNLGTKNLIEGTAKDSTYAGVIQGSGSLIKQNSGILTLTGNNTYSGGTTINGGTLALSDAGSLYSGGNVTINEGTFDISDITAESQTIGDLTGAGFVNLGSKMLIKGTDNHTTYHGVIQGGDDGVFIKQGSGTLKLTGSSVHTGHTLVAEGILHVSGELTSTVSVSPNTTLMGNGTVGHVINQGNVSPGESIGTMTVNGNYNQPSNGQLIIEIATNGATDLLQITGTATLDGALQIDPEPGIYANETIYTFLTASSVTGVFSSASSTFPVPYSVNYSPTSAFLIVSPGVVPPDVDLDKDEESIETGIIGPPFDFGDEDLIDLVGILITLPPDAYREALNKLSPSLFSAFALTGMENSYNVASTFFAQQVGQSPPCCEGIDATTNIWLSPIGFVYTQKNQQLVPGFNDHTYGVSGGVDGLIADDLSVGLGLGYTRSHINWNRGQGRANADSVYLGPYLKYNSRVFYLDLLVLGAGNFYEVDRKVKFPGYSRKTDSHPTTWNISETLLVGLRIPSFCRLGILFQPEIRLDQINIFQESFSESGGGIIDLSIEDRYSSFLRTLINAKFAREWSLCNVCLVPSVNVGWLRTTPLTGNHYTARLRNSTALRPFTVSGFHKTTDQILVGAQILAAYQGCFDFSLGYQGKFGEGATINEINMGLNWRF